MSIQQMVKAALQEKAPELFKQLQASGKLNQYVQDLSSQISSEIVTMTQEDRRRGKWDKLGPVACAAKMKMAEALNRETVLAQMLEFPQEGTSPQSQDETTNSDPTT